MRKDGFTLIELMVVIAIIAALAAVITPQVFRQAAKGRCRKDRYCYGWRDRWGGRLGA